MLYGETRSGQSRAPLGLGRVAEETKRLVQAIHDRKRVLGTHIEPEAAGLGIGYGHDVRPARLTKGRCRRVEHHGFSCGSSRERLGRCDARFLEQGSKARRLRPHALSRSTPQTKRHRRTEAMLEDRRREQVVGVRCERGIAHATNSGVAGKI